MDQVDVKCYAEPKSDNNATASCVVKTAYEMEKLCGEDQYCTANGNLGICLIFGHNSCIVNGKKDERKGNIVDQDRICKIMNNFGFDVRNYSDKSVSDIIEILKEVSRKSHSNNDCLVVVVMSHGEKGKIYASDESYTVDQLWEPFLGDKCSTLINKPKIFFIQACRGEKPDEPVSYMRLSPKFNRTCVDSCLVETRFSCRIPATADLLIMYSSFEGTSSFRNEVNGSWFIESLSRELEKALEHGIEIHDLLRNISQDVACRYESINEENPEIDRKKQMPTMVATLTKFFYLKKKN